MRSAGIRHRISLWSYITMCVVIPLAAQPSVLDSLRDVLPTSSGRPRLLLLHDLANRLEDADPAQALRYADEGIVLAEQLSDSVLLAELISSTAYSYGMLGDFPQSLRRGYRALLVSTLLKDKRLIASANSTLGITYVYIGQYSNALVHHFEALKIRQELGLVDRTIRTLNNIGIVYYNIGQYEKAIQYYTKAIELRKTTPQPRSIIRFLDNIGLAYTKLGNIAEAKRHHLEALALAEQEQYFEGMSYSNLNLGVMYTVSKQYDMAETYLLRALNLYTESGKKYGMLQAYNGLAEVYGSTGKNSAARNTLEKAIRLAESTKSPVQLQRSYELLSGVYAAEGQSAKAFRYLKLSTILKDSLFNKTESNKITDISVSIEMASKEKEIEALRQAQQITELRFAKEQSEKHLVYGVVLFLSVITLLLIYFYQRIQKQQVLLEQKNAELLKMNESLEVKINEVKLLSGLIPICSNCKKIRNDEGYWEQVEKFITSHSNAKFTHGICPDCITVLYPFYPPASKEENS